jgi:hypothetical protein
MMYHIKLEAYSAAKAAVRAYSKDPTVNNAAKVEVAWALVRKLNAVSVWRHKPLSGTSDRAGSLPTAGTPGPSRPM